MILPIYLFINFVFLFILSNFRQEKEKRKLEERHRQEIEIYHQIKSQLNKQQSETTKPKSFLYLKDTIKIQRLQSNEI